MLGEQAVLGKWQGLETILCMKGFIKWEHDFCKSHMIKHHEKLAFLQFILSWILYEKPNFEGPSIPLEEGELELTDIWGPGTSEEQTDCKSQKPAVIGSIRHVVKASNTRFFFFFYKS